MKHIHSKISLHFLLSKFQHHYCLKLRIFKNPSFKKDRAFIDLICLILTYVIKIELAMFKSLGKPHYLAKKTLNLNDCF